jgi:hypothetical protein
VPSYSRGSAGVRFFIFGPYFWSRGSSRGSARVALIGYPCDMSRLSMKTSR